MINDSNELFEMTVNWLKEDMVEYVKKLAETKDEAIRYRVAAEPHPLCDATTSMPSLHDHFGHTDPSLVGCILRDGHEVLHFDPVYGDWADRDIVMRPYSARTHLLRRLSLAPVNGGMAEDERLVDAFSREQTIKLNERILLMTRERMDLIRARDMYEKRAAEMMQDVAKLVALKNAGVDNWEGYSQAMSELYDDEE